MERADLLFICDIVRSRSGIVLGEDKEYLLESRLLPVARTFGEPDLHALVDRVRRTREEPLVITIVEAMTTNESSFFRDNKPFETLRQVILPKIMAAKGASRQLRFWSAACSTGQEPYSIAISLREERAKFAGWQSDIVATDIAQKVIDKAKQGIYSQFEVQRGMPIQMLMKYFSQVDNGWAVKPDIRACIDFRQQNLLEDIGRLGRFDVVFCRNVLIYFDDATKQKVLEAIRGVMNPGGALYLGSSETAMLAARYFKPFEGAQGVHTPL